MKLWLPVLLCAILFAGTFSCKKPNNSPIPFLSFTGFVPDTIIAGLNESKAHLLFHFSDGDGDLGNRGPNKYDVFLRDLRDSAYPVMQYTFPPIPDGAIDPIKGVSGDGAIEIIGSTISLRADTIHLVQGDTAIFEMWIMDRANHMSNVVTTKPLYIKQL